MGDFNSLLKTKHSKRKNDTHVEQVYKQAKNSSKDISLEELQLLNIKELEEKNSKNKIDSNLLDLWGMLEMKSYVDALSGNTINPYFLINQKLLPIKDLPDYMNLLDEARILNLIDIKFIKSFRLEGISFHNVFLVTYEILDKHNYFRPYVTLLTLNDNNEFVEFGYGYDTNDNGNVELFISSYNYLVFLTPKGTIHSPLSGKKTKLKVFDILTFHEILKLYKKDAR